MSKHEKKTSSLLHYPVLVVFSLFFIGLFALDMVTPDRSYSELENTTLSQRPALTQFTAKGLNSYFTAYTKYVKDQVAGRDQWISLQSVVETTLLQKQQNGGILLGKEHMMFPRTYGLLSSEERTLPKNTAALTSLCQRYPGKVNVLVAPAASDIYKENVPANAPLLDEDGYLDQLSAAVQAAGGSFVDVRQTLTAHKSEYIYYRTDHHWTSLGAYYAYSQLCDALGLTPFDTAAHTALTADNFYGTHYAKARTWNAVPDVITYYDLANTLTVWNVTAAGQPTEGQTTGLYDTEKLSVYDKYAMFLHGNNGLSRVQGNGSGRILVIKDSYANCFAKWGRNIIRAKGVCYFSNNPDMSFLFEQAGVQKKLKEAGLWYATAPEEELMEVMRREPGLLRDWDDKYGDRMQKIVFIGQHLDKEQLVRDLDACLE